MQTKKVPLKYGEFFIVNYLKEWYLPFLENFVKFLNRSDPTTLLLLCQEKKYLFLVLQSVIL